MNYNSLMNKPTINYRELIGDNTVTEVGGITEEQFNTLLNTDLSSYYTKAQIDDLFSRSYVYREKSGSIVTFDCPASINGIDKVVSEIVAVQAGNGDPSPTNVRPISGWSAVNVYDVGKNFYNPSFTRESGYYDDNGVLQTSSTTGHTQLTPINSNTEYYFSIHARSNGGGKFAVYFWDANRNWISRASKDYSSNFDDNNITFTTPNNCRFISFQVPIGTSVTSLEFDDSLTMICLNSLGTDFEAYNGTTYTTTLKDGQGNSMTCYGGELSNENGVQTLTNVLGLQNMATWNWVRESAGGGNYRFRSKSTVSSYYQKQSTEGLSSAFKINRSPISGAKIDNTLWVYSDGLVYIYCDTYTDVDSFKEFIKDVQLYLPRINPQTIPQDNLAIASSAGINNIWCDSGDITVKALDRIIQG